MLIVIFLSALVKPKDDDWSLISIKGWELDDASIVGELTHKGIGPNDRWITDKFYAENTGTVDSIYSRNGRNYICVSGGGEVRNYAFSHSDVPRVKVGQKVVTGDVLYSGRVINDVFYVDMSRILLVLLLLVICVMIWKGNKNIERKEARL